MKLLITTLLCLSSLLGLTQTFTATEGKFYRDIDSYDYSDVDLSLKIHLTDSTFTVIDMSTADTSTIKIEFKTQMGQDGLLAKIYLEILENKVKNPFILMVFREEDTDKIIGFSIKRGQSLLLFNVMNWLQC